MNKVVSVNIIRFFIIILAQVLIFKRISFSTEGLGYAHFLIYPLFILLLPVKTPKGVLLILAFITGLIVDIFYDSIGIHASALVFTAYIRNLFIALLEPYEGYNTDDSPTLKTMGIGWFVSYISICLFIHLFFYFSVEAFSFVFILDIFLNTVFSFFPSLIVIVLSQYIFKTKY
ncbi:MAG: hypothetical protein IPM42_08495 [Saprospiraceae bacterium]|nr:hypothetical protein [Saprospiraceae bacterium]